MNNVVLNQAGAGVDLFGINEQTSTIRTVWGIASLVSSVVSGYHGMKRNNGSIGYGALWFFLGGIMPVFVPLVAIAQGYAKPTKP
jgi:hypothetical protein